ncbi:hypothetical protein TVAG_261000 [Trichomonas vaginalis G3]|uniref:Uncharacterized protein n=1 Tax=Trichomonas vaginalis (strain ATCC PRA-98 / G3) TaxID=412133 RepID=A2FPR0_TRIV3|nr:hypothetical protein TVAG_261000 [Trichomonas vaginalis G3]|eukprot:XP_001306020.1 hypothetical protein [Trichomonas vaginalis G3]
MLFLTGAGGTPNLGETALAKKAREEAEAKAKEAEAKKE